MWTVDGIQSVGPQDQVRRQHRAAARWTEANAHARAGHQVRAPESTGAHDQRHRRHLQHRDGAQAFEGLWSPLSTARCRQCRRRRQRSTRGRRDPACSASTFDTAPELWNGFDLDAGNRARQRDARVVPRAERNLRPLTGDQPHVARRSRDRNRRWRCARARRGPAVHECCASQLTACRLNHARSLTGRSAHGLNFTGCVIAPLPAVSQAAKRTHFLPVGIERNLEMLAAHGRQVRRRR